FANRGMSSSLNGLVHAFAQRFLDPIPYDEDYCEQVKALSAEGDVVYVHRARNVISHLALSRVVQGLGLPKARFVGGLNVRWLRKWFGLFSPRRVPRNSPRDKGKREEWLLQECVKNGFAAELFLRRPLTLVSGKSNFAAQYVEALVALQRQREKPIFLVPHCLVLRSRPSSMEPKPTDLIFGTSGEPGLLRACFRMVLANKTARWEVSKPLNLKTFLSQFQHLEDKKVARKVRWTLLNHMARTERIFHGPPMKSTFRLKADTLKDPALQRVMEEQSKKKNQNAKKVQRKANHYFDEIAARFDTDVIFFFDRFLRLIWSRIYRGLVYEKSDIQKLHRAAQQGSLVLVPSHRSHVDYLVFSQVLFWEGLLPPHIAAGVNLSFFPLGTLLRRGGAYFIRRSFAGNVLYSTVFKSYVKRLLKDGFTQEFFIEGGRSRTGKTLPPKMGMLGMLVDAFMDSREKDLLFVPASISYEKIVESRSYVKELSGGQKEAESASGLLKSVGMLKQKYGRVYVTIDEPVSLNDYLEKMGLDRGLMEAEERRHLIKALAYHIVHGINCATVVTSTSLVATALLGLRRKGLSHQELLKQVQTLLAQIKRQEGIRYRIAPGLEEELDERIHQSIHLFVTDGLIEEADTDSDVFYRLKEKAYLVLDYYKNSVLHLFISDALVASAYLACVQETGEVSLDVLREKVKRLSGLFKLEFIFPTDKPFDVLFEEAVARMAGRGWMNAEGELLTSVSEEEQKELNFMAVLLLPFIEAYLAVAQKVVDFEGKSETLKSMLNILMQGLRSSYYAGSLVAFESQNEATLKNAFLALGELGVLQSAKNKPQLIPERRESLNECTELLKACHSATRAKLTL
ncbi:MAG: hypothetical protein CMH56_06860, partial [Myxococcales bacterium]|nr:hypothetical protein [Myxococcales bacterium]